MMSTPVYQDRPVLVSLHEVCKTYFTLSGQTPALKNVTTQFARGSFVGIIGRSGAGKSTLVNMITGIDHLTSGEIWINGTAVHAMSEDVMARWRGGHIGVVYQSFELLAQLTVLENVMMPMDFCNIIPVAQRKRRALELLEQVELTAHVNKSPALVSGGQQQRVAIARALANDPDLIVADEPTGSLDSLTGETIIQLFEALVRQGKTIVIVTHDHSLEKRFDHILQLDDGVIVNEKFTPRGREK